MIVEKKQQGGVCRRRITGEIYWRFVSMGGYHISFAILSLLRHIGKPTFPFPKHVIVLVVLIGVFRYDSGEICLKR